MRFAILAITCLFLLLSCKNEQQGTSVQRDDRKDQDSIPAASLGKEYSSEQWGFEVEYPPHYKLGEFSLPGESPVINIYDSTNTKSPPYAIHEDAILSYIALLPEGFGVDAPSGDRKDLGEWEGDLPLSFDVVEEESMVYLLENGEAWAYSLRLDNSPINWNQYATVFVHIKVDGFKAECFDRSSGEVKPMAECDPLGGNDNIKYYGNLDSDSEGDLISILQNLEFE